MSCLGSIMENLPPGVKLLPFRIGGDLLLVVSITVIIGYATVMSVRMENPETE